MAEIVLGFGVGGVCGRGEARAGKKEEIKKRQACSFSMLRVELI